MNRYSSIRQYWIEFFTTSVLLIAITLYLVLKTPIIFVPNQIKAQWDSVWLAHMPKPCSVQNALGSCWPIEVSGCVKIERAFGDWEVESWALAKNQVNVPMGSTGTCDSSYNATWHIHPAELRETGSFVPGRISHETYLFFPELSGADLEALRKEPPFVLASIMTYTPGKMTAAIKWRGRLIYPVRVQ